MVKVGMIGGIMGVIAEVWYFHDYWQPPMLWKTGWPGIEDFIIGFAMFGVGGYIHASFTRQQIDEPETRLLYLTAASLQLAPGECR